MPRYTILVTVAFLSLGAQVSAYGTSPESSLPLFPPQPNTCAPPSGEFQISLPATV